MRSNIFMDLLLFRMFKASSIHSLLMISLKNQFASGLAFKGLYLQAAEVVTLLSGGNMSELTHPAPAVRVRANVGIHLTHRTWDN